MKSLVMEREMKYKTNGKSQEKQLTKVLRFIPSFLFVFLVIIIPSFLWAYTPHKLIVIDGDNQFTKKNGVVSGSGTETDPYIIKGWDIKISEGIGVGIEIKNTSKCFIIKDCYIQGDSNSPYNTGIYIAGKEDWAKIENVKIEYANHGIYNNYTIKSIKNCTISGCSHDGIHNDGAIESITNCAISDCEDDGIGNNGTIKSITNCNIEKNEDYGLVNEPSIIIDARNCWWGSSDGPSGIGSGTGDRIRGKVQYKPFAKERVKNAGASK